MKIYNPSSKGPLNGWLVASDVDGTVNSKLRYTPKRNVEAIRRFTRLGGFFTLASGRSVESVEAKYRSLPIDDVPAIVLNGACIWDFTEGRELAWHGLDRTAETVVADAAQCFPSIGLDVYTHSTVFTSGPAPLSDFLVVGYSNRRYDSVGDMPSGEWGKVVFNGIPSEIKLLKAFLDSANDGSYNVVSSSIASVEVLGRGVSKGDALLELADMMNISHEKTGAIGDYFNDESMIRMAGLSAACGQAPEALRNLADYVTCHCNQGAVADFLDYIEDNF